MEVPMPDPNYPLLYVESPAASARFYGELLGRKPVQNSPIFALFVLASGAKLALWARADVPPTAPEAIGGNEIAFPLPGLAAVHAAHDAFRARGLRIAQAPTEM